MTTHTSNRQTQLVALLQYIRSWFPFLVFIALAFAILITLVVLLALAGESLSGREPYIETSYLWLAGNTLYTFLASMLVFSLFLLILWPIAFLGFCRVNSGREGLIIGSKEATVDAAAVRRVISDRFTRFGCTGRWVRLPGNSKYVFGSRLSSQSWWWRIYVVVEKMKTGRTRATFVQLPRWRWVLSGFIGGMRTSRSPHNRDPFWMTILTSISETESD